MVLKFVELTLAMEYFYPKALISSLNPLQLAPIVNNTVKGS